LNSSGLLLSILALFDALMQCRAIKVKIDVRKDGRFLGELREA